MSLEPMFADLDPLMWAKRPRSQTALDLVQKGVNEGDSRLIAIHAEHIRNGVCDNAGKLLRRWDGLRWQRIAGERYRDAA